ncbi:MAG: hypothetical protein ACKO2V_27315, partial [Snowella sp.]
WEKARTIFEEQGDETIFHPQENIEENEISLADLLANSKNSSLYVCAFAIAKDCYPLTIPRHKITLDDLRKISQ